MWRYGDTGEGLVEVIGDMKPEMEIKIIRIGEPEIPFENFDAPVEPLTEQELKAISDSDWAIPTGFIDDMKEIERYKNRKALATILLSNPSMKLLWDMPIVGIEKESLERKVK